MLLHASFSLADDLLSIVGIDPAFGEVLEAPVSTVSTRGHHRTIKPCEDEIILHWFIFFSY